jgi:GDP-L-fucose synthase
MQSNARIFITGSRDHRPPGPIVNDTSKPDGAPRKPLDASRLHAMDRKATPLRGSIEQTCPWFLDHQAQRRAG